MSRSVFAHFLAVVVAGGGAVLPAQEPSAPLPTLLEGLTMDAQTGKPFPNVQIRFDDGRRITSDDQGRYMIEGVSPGHHRVALVTGRCNVTFADLELAPGQIKRIAFQVPSEMGPPGPSAEEMKKQSEGKYYTGEELEEMRVRNLLEAVRRVAPEMVGAAGGQPGSSASLMGRTRSATGISVPVVVFDEIQVGDGVKALQDVLPTEIFSLEILRGASRGWEYGTGGSGGVIKVVTRHGNPGFGVLPPDRCEIGDWVGRGGPAGS